MNGHEVKQRAQTAREMTEEIDRATEAMVGFGVTPDVGQRLDAVGGRGGSNGFEGRGLGGGVEERGFGSARREGMDPAQARGIGGLAMGQVLTYNPEASVLSTQMEAVPGERQGMPEYGAVQGRNADQMMGVAGKSLGELERPSAFAQMENERVRETAELDNGYARNEIAPNLSSVGLASKTEEAYRKVADEGNGRAEFKAESFDDRLQNETQEGIGKVMAGDVEKLRRQKEFRPNDIVKMRDEGMITMLKAFKTPRFFKERNG